MTHCQMFFYLTNDEPFKHRLLLITRNSATQPGCVIEYKSLNSANWEGGRGGTFLLSMATKRNKAPCWNKYRQYLLEVHCLIGKAVLNPHKNLLPSLWLRDSHLAYACACGCMYYPVLVSVRARLKMNG